MRLELTVPCGTPVFKTGALNRYATPPRVYAATGDESPEGVLFVPYGALGRKKRRYMISRRPSVFTIRSAINQYF